MSFITRFAPSPTGDLHIGSARTALYCWLFARKNNGKLILRIEDTDLERSTQASVDVILNGLTWLGLNWDEGPLFQSKRFPRYLEVVDQLLEKKLAYRCDCTKERLEQLRTTQMNNKQKPKYDGLCREKNIPNSHSSPYVIRFKNPLEGWVEFDDLVRGKVKIANSELDDLILLRSDLTPTYNLTVVIDDIDLQITDVIRGEDHISNTPKQINLLLAIGAKLPRYAHISMILGTDGSRLSKRHGASSILEYEKMGILPHALINYLARLGWSYKDQEIFSIEELINLFDIRSVNKSAAIFNLDKLLWLNHYYISHSTPEDLAEPFTKLLRNQLTIDDSTQTYNLNNINKIIALYQKRVKTLKEMVIESCYLFQNDLEIDFNLFPIILSNIRDNPKIIEGLKNLVQKLKSISGWEPDLIKNSLHSTVEENSLKFSELAIPLRVFTTGRDQTPSIDQVLTLLGKERTLDRIYKGLKKFK